MNGKKAKALRRMVANVDDAPPEITFHERLMHGPVPMSHRVVNPIRYPDNSKRRVYQDAKRAA